MSALARLRARGTVVIEADSDGFTVSWWPKGQKGNPFCGRGGKVDSPAAMEALFVEIEEASRPRWFPSVDAVKEARIHEAEQQRQRRQRTALYIIDKEDRKRERWKRQSEEFRRKREGDELRRRRRVS